MIFFANELDVKNISDCFVTVQLIIDNGRSAAYFVEDLSST
jgi:hypothetical protein